MQFMIVWVGPHRIGVHPVYRRAYGNRASRDSDRLPVLRLHDVEVADVNLLDSDVFQLPIDETVADKIVKVTSLFSDLLHDSLFLRNEKLLYRCNHNGVLENLKK